jgi:hypothetical protein
LENILENLSNVLTLPTTVVRPSRLASAKPIVDYSKSILLTFDEYLIQVQSLATKQTDAANAEEARKVATDKRKIKHEEERILQI